MAKFYEDEEDAIKRKIQLEVVEGDRARRRMTSVYDEIMYGLLRDMKIPVSVINDFIRLWLYNKCLEIDKLAVGYPIKWQLLCLEVEYARGPMRIGLFAKDPLVIEDMREGIGAIQKLEDDKRTKVIFPAEKWNQEEEEGEPF